MFLFESGTVGTKRDVQADCELGCATFFETEYRSSRSARYQSTWRRACQAAWKNTDALRMSVGNSPRRSRPATPAPLLWRWRNNGTVWPSSKSAPPLCA